MAYVADARRTGVQKRRFWSTSLQDKHTYYLLTAIRPLRPFPGMGCGISISLVSGIVLYGSG